MDARQYNSVFPNTRWTLVEALQNQLHPHHGDALETLSSMYWPPIYAFIRSKGRKPDDAAELAQAFFADVVLQRRIFEQADASRGKLRTLLLQALRNFLVDGYRRKSARREDQAVSIENLSREEEILMEQGIEDPDRVFDRRWALTMLHESLRRCEQHFRESDRLPHWLAFEARTLRPSISMGTPPTYDELSGRFGFESASEVETAVRGVRKRVLMVLRQIAAETASDPSDQQAEYNHVVELLT